MKKLTKILLNNTETLNFIVLAVFIVSLVFSSAINSLAIILILVAAVFNKLFLKENCSPNNKTTQILVLYFGLIILNTIFHGDYKEIFHFTVKFSPFLIFPLGVQYLSISKEKTNALFYLYIGVLFLYCLTAIAYQFYYRYQIGEEVWLAAGGWAFFAWNLTHLFDFHSPYLGMYISLAILMILKFNNWQINFNSSKNSILTIVYAFFFLFIFFIGVKNSIVFNSIILIVVVIYQIKNKKYLPVVFIFVISVIFFLLLPKNYLMQKFRNITTSTDVIKLDYERYNLNKIHYEMALEYPILGTGIKAYPEVIKNKYLFYNFESGLNENLNAHNQFMQSTVFFGFLGLILLIFIFYYAFKFCKKTKDLLFFLFLLLCFSAMLTESIFVTQRGIVFFSFFYSFFLVTKKSLHKQKIIIY